MNTLPTEYFGPHAKRWTHPDTGVSYSLKPRDYHQLVAAQKEWEEERREEELRDEAVSAAWDDKALDHPTFNTETMGVEQAIADIYGVPVVKHSDWPNVISPAPIVTAAKMNTAHLEISADGIKPLTVEGSDVVQRGRVRFLSLVEDDTFGCIRPVEQTAPGAPAARHFKRRRITRNLMRLGLVYIIAIIGVIAVTGVIS